MNRLVPERELILFRGGCTNRIMGVFELPGLKAALQ